MNRRGLMGALLGGILLTAVGGCGSGGKSANKAEVRYRVTVEVDDHGTIRKGSSVWSWTLIRPTLALATPYGGKFKGEAVAVDLSGGQTLFALVRGQEMLPERHFAQFNAGDAAGRIALGDRIANIHSIASHIGARADVPCKKWIEGSDYKYKQFDPVYDCVPLVTFKNIDDPKSVTEVDPHYLAASLGGGVKLKAITVEITDAPVTIGIEKRLQWIDHLKNYRRDNDNPFTNTLPSQIGGLRRN